MAKEIQEKNALTVHYLMFFFDRDKHYFLFLTASDGLELGKIKGTLIGIIFSCRYSNFEIHKVCTLQHLIF